MSSKANILKKFRRWLRKMETGRESVIAESRILSRNSLSIQVGKLLKDRGSEIITMTTL